MKVVFPEPRKPVTIVTGILGLIGNLLNFELELQKRSKCLIIKLTHFFEIIFKLIVLDFC